jgi:hypothetical protein
VLALVGEDQLVDETVAEQALVRVLKLGQVEHLERSLADLGHVGTQLVAAQDRQLVAGPARVLDRVVEAPELAAQRLTVADPLDQPELFEVGNVAEIPGERAEDRRVDGVQLPLAERLDEEQGARSCVRQTVGDPLAEIGLRGGRDRISLPG